MRHVGTLLSVVFLACVLSSAPAGLAQTLSFTPIAPSGATFTWASGINGSNGSNCRSAPGWAVSPGLHNGQTQGQHLGLCKNAGQTSGATQQIVGHYWDSTWQSHSYTLSGTTFGAVNVPVVGTTTSTASGVNSSGQIVGFYVTGSQIHGFVLTGSTCATAACVTTIDDPSATFGTYAYGLNTAGQVVGTYQDAMGVYHGFLFSGGTFTNFDYPGAYWTIATGINASGQIVGYYYNPGDFRVTYAFLRSPTGNMTTLNIPGAFSAEAYGINTSGQIVGFYVDAVSFHGYGFLLSGGISNQINIPQSLSTVANGIDDSGVIVGEYTDASQIQYGFHMP